MRECCSIMHITLLLCWKYHNDFPAYLDILTHAFSHMCLVHKHSYMYMYICIQYCEYMYIYICIYMCIYCVLIKAHVFRRAHLCMVENTGINLGRKIGRKTRAFHFISFLPLLSLALLYHFYHFFIIL